MNKYSLMVLASSTIKSWQIFATLYFLKTLTPSTFYFIESLLIILISSILIFFKKEYKEFKFITKNYAKLLFGSNFIVIISILLSLTMFSSLWVVLTSLLSLLYLVFIYILWYFILKEVPSKKDILITIFVSICIIVWTIFKN
jgi:drug/metabolite transporter (DMT)-like permease